VSIRSEVGHGTTVTLYLPAADTRAMPDQGTAQRCVAPASS
jgi:hypothetical protein